MTFQELLKERRSIRSFKDEPIPHADIALIAEAAQMAPSWKNLQPSRVYIAESKEVLEELRSRGLPSFNQKSSANAILMVTTFVKGQSGHTGGTPDNELGDLWGAYDLGLHDSYLILAARDLGYDTLIMGIRDAEEIRRILSIPEDEVIVSVIALGKRNQVPSLRPRKAPSDVIRYF